METRLIEDVHTAEQTDTSSDSPLLSLVASEEAKQPAGAAQPID